MDVLVERVLAAPLALGTLSWGGVTGPLGAAVRYGPDGRVYPGYTTDHPAASEAWCSIEDLVAIGRAQLERSLFDPAVHDLLVTPAAPRQDDGAAYGLGWVTRQVGSAGVDLWVHAGRMGGVSAHLAVLPAEGVVIAGVANTETDVLAAAAADIVGALVEGYEPPAGQPGWAAGPAHRDVARLWRGVIRLGAEEHAFEIDAAADEMTATVAGRTTRLVAPCITPDRIAAHLSLGEPFTLAPPGALTHLDLRPHGDAFAGMATFAQYPNDTRWRQGDAVSAAVVVTAD